MRKLSKTIAITTMSSVNSKISKLQQTIRVFIIMLLLFMGSIALQAQENNKLAPAFRYLISHPLNSETRNNYPDLYKIEMVEGFNSNTGLHEKGYMCIIYTTNAKILINKGITVHSVLPNFVTAWASLNQISQLSEMSEVSYVEAPQVLLPNNEISAGSSGASLLNAGRLNNTIYKGDGVIVGVFDSGIDWDHLDFRDSADNTKSRILRIWDQTITPITGEASPTGFNYGVEYTQAHLNNELDGTPAGYVREQDLTGHGTHVAGTAAGNGAALSKKYAGIAPKSDIVVVKGGNSSFSQINTINALTYFQNVATALGKPIVVNMSIGGQSGAHDGTNAHEIAVDNFSNAAAGRVVVIAAGNDNGTLIHKQVALAANGSDSMTVNVPTASGSSSTNVFQIAIYANNANAVNAVVTMPDNTTVTANAGQIISPSVLSNTATVYLDNVVDPASGVRIINLYVQRNSTSANPSGNWKIALNNTTATALTIDGWLNFKGADFVGTTVSGGDNNYLVASPGTATNAITVGSFMGKLDWYSTSTTAPGGYAYSSGQQDNISTFSSRGPRRDNVMKPNITANGQAVVSCLASDAGISPTSSTIVVQGLYRAIEGTSMATPAVAGCVALLLQAKPTATFSQLRNAITTTATKDNFTTATDNATWGSGKIDVFKAASSLLLCKPSSRTTYSYDSSSTNTNNLQLNLGSLRAATRFTPDMTGKLGGVYFKTGTTVTLTSFAIEVRTNSGGIPGTLLGSLSITPSSISRFSWNYYDVSSLNVSVTNGTDYFIVLVPGSSDSWFLGFESLSNSGRSFYGNGSSWTAYNDLRIRSVVYDNALPTSSSTTNASICSGSNYTFNGNNYSSAGTYIANLTTAGGCDSTAILILTVNALPTVATITGTTNVCNTLTTQLASTTPSGVWKSVSPATATISATGLVTGVAAGTSIIRYTVTNGSGCIDSVSTTVTINPTTTPVVSINSNTNNISQGTSVTFTATPSNGGSTPAYQWKKNGTNVGTNSVTYIDATLQNGDVITCVLTSNDPCASPVTGTSSGITMIVITTTTWNGSSWSNGVPTSTSNAIIASSIAPASFTCNDLTINSTYSLTTTGITATVHGNIVNNGNGIAGTGGITIAANSIISGNAINFNGTLTLNGSIAQTMNANGATVQNLTINNTSGVTLTGALNLTGVLTPTSGVLTTGGNLTLKSFANNSASIASNVSGSTYILGNVNVERFISGQANRGRWRFLSSAITNATVANWMTHFYVTGPGDSVPANRVNGSTLGTLNSSGWHTNMANISFPSSTMGSHPSSVKTTSIRTYNESVITGDINSGWENLTSSAQALTPGRGFRAFIRGDINAPNSANTQLGPSANSNIQGAVNLTLTGPVNQGPINANPTFTSSGTIGNDGWNLIGNPYACSYNLFAHINAPSNSAFFANISPTVYVYSAITNGYISYNTAGGGTNGGLDNGIVPKGAAFYIKATSANPIFIFQEAFKTTNAHLTGGVHKTGIKTEEFGIKYYKDSTENDYTVIKMYNGATLNNDVYDIVKVRNDNLNLAAYGTDSVNLTASVIPPVISETRIKLNVEATQVGTYHFDFTNMDNFEKDITVSLFDRFTNKTTDVRKNTKYTFVMDAGLNQWGNNRFELILNKTTTGIEDLAQKIANTNLLVYPNPATDVLNINIGNANFKNSEVVVYNVSGAEVYNGIMDTNQTQINIQNLSAGVYLINVSNQNGFNKTVKFVK